MKLIEIIDHREASVTIQKLQPHEINAALAVGAQCFPQMTLKEFSAIVRGELNNDFSKCYVAKDRDKIVGGYFLGDAQLYDPQYSETFEFKNKRGIQGECLFLLSNYRNQGIGRKLRDIPLHLGYDYIWGEHLVDLNNIDMWLKFGRRFIMTVGNVHYTVMDLQ